MCPSSHTHPSPLSALHVRVFVCVCLCLFVSLPPPPPLPPLQQEDGKPLKDLTVTFCRIFPKTDHFRAGCAVSVLLTDRLLTLSQRIVAWYILHTVYVMQASCVNSLLSSGCAPELTQPCTHRFAPGPDGTPPHNPFLLVFLDAMEAATAAPTPEYAAEVALLVQLLSARDADVSALTAEAVLRAPPRAAPAQLPDFTALRKAYHAASPVPRLAALEVRPVVLAPTPSLWGFKPPSLVQAAAPSVPFAPGTFPAPRVPSTTASAAPQRSTGAGSGAGAGAAATTGTSASGKSDNGSGSGADAAAPTATAATATSAADADRIRMLKATAARMLPPALLSLRGVKPEFARPPPPLLDVKESEVCMCVCVSLSVIVCLSVCHCLALSGIVCLCMYGSVSVCH